MLLDSSGAVTLRPSFPFSSGRDLRPNALLYVVTRLLREKPAPFGVAIIVLDLGWQRSFLMGVVVGSIFGCRGADAEQESTSDGKRARPVGLWAVYASAASTTQWNTPLTRLAGAVGRLLTSAEDGMGEGVPRSYSALSGLCVNGAVWSVRICLGGGSVE